MRLAVATQIARSLALQQFGREAEILVQVEVLVATALFA